MAIQIIGTNINQYGGSGEFESDRSTWGFSNPTGKIVTRSSLQKVNGFYSALVVNNSNDSENIIRCRFTIPRMFLLKAKVRVPSSTPITDNDEVISIKQVNVSETLQWNEEYSVTKTVEEALDTWVEIEAVGEFIAFDTAPPNTNYTTSIIVSGDHIEGGQIFVDDFKVYPVIEVDEDPDPPGTFDKAYFHKNPITFGAAGVSGWEALNNYRVYADVRVEEESDSGEYNSKLKVRLYPETNGNVDFYIRQAFNEVMAPENIIPPVNSTEITKLTDRLKRFKVYTGSIQDDETEPEVLTESLTMLVLWGGIDKFNYPGLDFFGTYLTANKKFMSWAPVKKTVDRLQPDYLNFWVYSGDIATLQLHAKIYFDDDTNDTTILKTLAGVYKGELYQIPSGPANSGVLLYAPEKNVIRYELSLLDQDDVLISEVRYYTVTHVRHPLTRFFMFLNSLGTYEVLYFKGQAKEQTSFQREVVQRFLPHDYDQADGELAVNNPTFQKKTNYSSGFLTGPLAKEWYKYLTDFMLSPRVYEITNGELRRVIVSTENMPGEQDQNYLRFVRFEGQDSFINESFTPEI